jgi:phosphate-selective porin OprO/OprP
MRFNKKLAVAVSGAVLLMAGQFALADSTTDIVDALVSKGVLTEEEGKLITKGHTSAKDKQPVVKEKDGAFKLESANGNNSIQLTGRLHFDARSIDTNTGAENKTNFIDKDSTSLADQFEVRRARIGVKGTFAKHYDYEVLTNLVGSSSNLLDVAYVNAGMYKPLQFKAGLFKQPFNLEEYGTSSNNIDFMERSYVNQLTPAKKAGFMLHGALENGITYAGSVYQQNTFGEVDAENTGKGFAGRATMNLSQLMGSKETVFHIGVAGFDSEYGVTPTTSSSGGTATAATIVNFRTEGRGIANAYRAQIGGTAATSGYSAPSPNTASMQNKAYGLELAAAYGPFKVQGEYTAQDFKADAATNTASLDAKAYYIEAMWMLTGENYADWYKNGAWGGIKPKKEFNAETLTGLGAWEIGLRYDAYDVDNVAFNTDGSATNLNRIQGSNSAASSCAATGSSAAVSYCAAGGGAKTYTAGIKWQLNPNMRVLANYSHTKFDDAFTVADTSVSGVNKEDILMVRTQFNF